MEEAITQQNNAEPVIRVRDLVFRRGRRTILDGVSMDIPRGSIVAFMGPSGVGKTTILRLISGQLRPDEGSIEINGHLISQDGRESWQRYGRVLRLQPIS